MLVRFARIFLKNLPTINLLVPTKVDIEKIPTVFHSPKRYAERQCVKLNVAGR